MENFIEQVRVHLCLWDVNSVMYRDLSRKESCWENVARECDMESGKEAKLLWKRLRDSHREALRRRRTHGTQIVRPWKYEHLMEFVRPNRDKDEPASEPGASHSDPLEEPDICTPTQTCAQINRLIKKTPSQTSTLKTFEERATRRRRELARTKLLIKSKSKPPVSDAITELFSSMCKKTKQLPLHLQLRVQREMFESVSRAEEEALCDDEAARVSIAGVGGNKPPLIFKASPVSDPDTDSPHVSRDEDLHSDD